MNRFLACLIALSLLAVPAPALAQEPEIVEKTVCLGATGFPDVAALKDSLLAAVKREAVSEFFGELISASTAVENLVVTSDQIQASSLGFVRIFGDPRYYNGESLAEVCVTIEAYVTESDRAQFDPVTVSKRLCLANSELTADALTALVRKEVVIQALLDYDPKLESADRARLPSLMERITYTEGGFLPDTTTYCAAIEGLVTPVEVLAFTLPGAAAAGAAAAGAAAPSAPAPGAAAASATAASATAAGATAATGEALGEVVEIPVVESEHPYANGSAESWFISNDSALGAMQIHFSRIEIEEGVDRIRIADVDGRTMQEITTSYPDGLWSDLVPGAGAYIELQSDGADTAWGFSVDSVAAVEHLTIGYSAHPYDPNLAHEATFLNDSIDAEGTQLVFNRIELEENVDWLVVRDVNGVPYQWITGNHPAGVTTLVVPGPAVKLLLQSDSSNGAWGYDVREVVSGAAQEPESEPEFETLAESPHPYSEDYTHEWTLTNRDPNAKSTKVHFSRIEMNYYGRIELLDASNTLIQVIETNELLTDVWTDSVPGRVVKLRFGSGGRSGWGFRVDRLAAAVPNPGLAQTDHPYAENFVHEWTLTNRDTAAKSTKVHFDRLELNYYGKIELLDAINTVIQTIDGAAAGTDFWSEYVPGRVVKVRFDSGGRSAWGFRIDALASSVLAPGLAQTHHPYPEGYANEWTLTNPDQDAKSTRLHFERIDLNYYGTIEILDAKGTVIQSIDNSLNGTDIWSDYVQGRVVRVRFDSGGRSGWGFRIDQIESK